MSLKRIKVLTVGLLLIFGISLYGCNHHQIKFAKDKWNEQSDPLYPSAYRQKFPAIDFIASILNIGLWSLKIY